VSNCQIAANTANWSGGGIFCDNSSPTASNCEITANTADGGGGICCNLSSPTVIDCQITANTGISSGGGIRCDNSSPTVSSCQITANAAGSWGGGIYCYKSDRTVSNCQIIANTADYGGGIYCREYSPTVSNCQITANTANYGGGIYFYDDGVPTVSSCQITANTADYGAGIYCNKSDPTVSNCQITANTADYGGGIYCNNSSLTVANCSLIGNFAWAYYGGGGIYSANYSTPIIKNNIVAKSDFGCGISAVYSVPVLSYNNLYNNFPANYGDWALPGTGDISLDPCFAEPGEWTDPCNTPADANDDVWIDGDYHLKSQAGRWDPVAQMWLTDAVTSPCIDAGDPNSEWTAELWPHGKRINMGTYGGTPEASMSLSGVGNIADLNNDGIVNLTDYGFLAGKYATREVLLREDLNRNVYVDGTDVGIFVGEWLWQE
jgi:hypothetical protein